DLGHPQLASDYRRHAPVASVDLDLHVHAGGEIQLRQRVDRLRPRVDDVDHALVRLQLELLAALLVDVGRAQNRPALDPRGEPDRPAPARTGLLRRPHDVRRGLIDHRVIERLQPTADLARHVSLPSPLTPITRCPPWRRRRRRGGRPRGPPPAAPPPAAAARSARSSSAHCPPAPPAAPPPAAWPSPSRPSAGSRTAAGRQGRTECADHPPPSSART